MPSQKYYGRRETSRMSCPPVQTATLAPTESISRKQKSIVAADAGSQSATETTAVTAIRTSPRMTGGFLRALAWGVTKGAITSAAYIGIQKVVDIIFDQRRR
ncbi:hypothetical protein PG987_001818 [Apiospora arundinis]